ncbi:MAG TPA: preprotein translocase subunit SecA [Gammaproteobacteria bacterium]|nr:preprotein translocase subunit SecA [Pseudomonadota bacterium]HCK94009.1 preprotein translocase subunit SecA [Gammaproteobacteria bacterium]|tara:strand:+ start:2156 stop:4888 length:2733 start_codon:yes stop_codon:yes gene_type:complete
MFSKILSTVFGSKNSRELKRLSAIVKKINSYSDDFKKLSDEELAGKTPYFKELLEKGQSLDSILPEAFATAREAATRVLGMRHYDCQLIGGMVLNGGNIAEMRTGEGKTLVGTLPVYLNALTGKGVHVVTVNDYLVTRDAAWMKPLYEFLGLTVGTVVSRQPAHEKQAAYQCDITYCTNNELGFDYLRDNMCFRLQDRAQRGHAFALVDEVDSILIDEARTPLIISGPSVDSSEMYRQIAQITPALQPAPPGSDPKEGPVEGDFMIDEKNRTIELTDAGHEKIEGLLIDAGLLKEGDSLYSATNLGLLHHIQAGLKALFLFHKDDHYLIQNGKIVIIDEHTGRLMPGRRWSDGIHQSIEAKEGLKIEQENQTLASTTFQNYFRLYDKLAGMTGTADTEAYEFHQIYGLDVVVIPTNKPTVRKDYDDQLFMTKGEKLNAVVEDIMENNKLGRPVLVGTRSVESSEEVSKVLKKNKIPHQVLNAKLHDREAQIVAEAGRPGAVTIATNMAGRGTDIMLGGSWKTEVEQLDNPTPEQIEKIKADWQTRHDAVKESGGLHIISTERHESRRIDNQLRGRSGRQGDPGSSRFYLSLDDELMRIFAAERMRNMIRSVGMEEGEAIEHRWVTRLIENAQRKVENHNFDMRKNLLEYDNVANEQRQIIYHQRNEILEAEDFSDFVDGFFEDAVFGFVETLSYGQVNVKAESALSWKQELDQAFFQDIPVQTLIEKQPNHAKAVSVRTLAEDIYHAVLETHKAKLGMLDERQKNQIEREVTLSVLDRLWKEHLLSMDHLRQGIHLRGYAQKNPKQEYKRESHELFQRLLGNIRGEVVSMLCAMQIRSPEEVNQFEEQELAAREDEKEQSHSGSSLEAEDDAQSKDLTTYNGVKVSRNDPCPCGSGKKFKRCHGSVVQAD